MQRLDDAEIGEKLGTLAGWNRTGEALRREYRFDGFGDAIAFVNRVAELAEEADHHPDIDVRYDRVVLTLSTHSAGGITARDFELAARIG